MAKSVRQVLLHVQGDREAAIRCLVDNNIKYKKIKGTIQVKNASITISETGDYGNSLRFSPQWARQLEGKPVENPNLGWGDTYLSFKEQEKIFNMLKRSIMKHRSAYYRETEEKMAHEKEERDKQIEEIRSLIDFEKNLLKEEHDLKSQIDKTIKFLLKFQKYFPNATFSSPVMIPGKVVFPYKGPDSEKSAELLTADRSRQSRTARHKKVDSGMLSSFIVMLGEILGYLKQENIETLKILKDLENPVQVEKNKEFVNVQKEHLKKLARMLDLFVRAIKHSLKRDIKDMQITAVMKRDLKYFFEKMLQTYEWYADLFKKESRK